MFRYKFCSKCQKRNHKSSWYCTRCGDDLGDAPKFSKAVFAVTLGIVVLLSSATVFASKSYFNKKSASNSQQDAQIQSITPTPTPAEIIASPEPTRESVRNKPIVKTTIAPAETETTPPPVVKAVCDESQATLAASKFKVSYNEALSEFKSKMKPDNTGAEDQAAMDELNTKVAYYYHQYVQDMKSANCTPEQLVGGLIPS